MFHTPHGPRSQFQSTVLLTTDTVDTVEIVYTDDAVDTVDIVFTDDAVDMACTVNMVYTVDIV